MRDIGSSESTPCRMAYYDRRKHNVFGGVSTCQVQLSVTASFVNPGIYVVPQRKGTYGVRERDKGDHSFLNGHVF